MSAQESRGVELVAEVAVLLGAPDGASPDGVTSESVHRLTQRQLLDVSKKLGLSGVAKLRKDALVRKVLRAWHDLTGVPKDHPHRAANDAHVEAHGDDGHPSDDDSAGVDSGAIATGATGVTAATTATTTTTGAVGHDPFSHKFEVGQPGRDSSQQSLDILRESSKAIPWGYGRDRVTAMPIDPDRLFAYWEVLDDSIAKARKQLGARGADAWLNLRVYDTTGRMFDGTNAHSNFDHRIERGDRQWFFTIGRPTSELIVEIGLKSDEGYFVKIARSGRVEFPRRESAPWSEPEWLTVRTAGNQIERGGFQSPGRATRSNGVPASALPPPEPVTAPAAFPVSISEGDSWEAAVTLAQGHGAEHLQWVEVQTDGAFEAHHDMRWQGPTTVTAWEAGPFPHPVELPNPIREMHHGKTRVFRSGARTHVVYGPWQVVIRSLRAQQSRVVLSRWEVYRSWAEATSHAVEESVTTFTGGGASGGMVGASERRWTAASELRLGGSSEVYYLQASELRLMGASERLYAGASEMRLRGASERMYVGASEWLTRGAGGATYPGGASEARLAGGASENLTRQPYPLATDASPTGNPNPHQPSRKGS